ncbi:MAG: hypothetical protein MZV63_45565 [Marinilabiliales bacterium]|nr:hypothetical protein [Marinilabiliales bacterium]
MTTGRAQDRLLRLTLPTSALMELAENVRIENCTVNYGVLEALFDR